MRLRSALQAAALRLPPIRRLAEGRDRLLLERDRLLLERDRLTARYDDLVSRYERERQPAPFVPPGHFYSPIPSLDEVARDAHRLYAAPPRTLPGIDMREEAQVALLTDYARFYDEMPWAPERRPELRYWFENGAYSYGDAIALHATLRHLAPKRVIEIGSGHSSCVTLDTNERCFGNQIETVFIEPYPELLHSLLKPGDLDRIEIMPSRLQDVPLDLFATLDANDVLFIDSTHVGKIGSDVNLIFADILPALRSGVRVHFHDVFYPFEYPRFWIEEGRAWNEAYMLRCFLQYNQRFQIELMSDYLARFHAELLERHMPLFLRNPGASLWLRAC